MDDPYPDITRNLTVLAVVECASCKRNNTMRMNVSNRAYVTCKWPTGDDGLICNEQHRYSKNMTAFHVKTYRKNLLKMKGRTDGTGQNNEENTGKPDDDQRGVYDFYRT